MNHKGTKTLETERLILRQFTLQIFNIIVHVVIGTTNKNHREKHQTKAQ